MARLASIGLETRDTSEFTTISTNFCTASSTAAHSGTYAMRMYAGSTYASFQTVSLTEFYLGFWINHNGAGGLTATLVSWWAGATQLGSVRLNINTHTVGVYTSTGTLVATSTLTITKSTWHHVQVHVKYADSGNIDVKLDGADAITYAGDTKPGSDAAILLILMGTSVSSQDFSNYAYLDDIVLNDTAGGVDDSWPGDVRLVPFFPSSAGNAAQFTPNTGTNVAAVDDCASGVHDSDTTYNSVGAVDQVDSFVATNPTLPAGTVSAVIVKTIARKTDAGVATLIAPFIRSATTDSAPTDCALPASYGAVLAENRWLLDPADSAAWTSAKVNALEIGYKSRGVYA